MPQEPLYSEQTNLNLQSLEGVTRYRDPQRQGTENYLDLYNLDHNVFQILHF